MSINFNNSKIRKSTFYKNKKINNIYNIDVNDLSVSKKESYGNKNSLKYFIGYNDNDIIRPLCIRLPQMTGYVRKFGENATMSLIVKDKQLLKSCTKIWEKIVKLMKINFESEPVYGDDDKYIKTKIKIYPGSMITNSHNKKRKSTVPMLSIIMIDSVIKANKKYYPQMLLEECKYVQEKKIENYIKEDLENSESDSDSNNDTESDGDSNIETESDIDNDDK